MDALGYCRCDILRKLDGFLGTDNGSAHGRGQEWTLCSGQNVPWLRNVQRAMEFGHRGVSSFGSP